MKLFVNNLKTLLLLGGLSGVLMAGGALLGGSTGVIIALVIAFVINIVGVFFSDKIALASMQAVEVGEDHPLYQITHRLASRAQMPMPRVYVSPQPAPNAFATGRSPKHAAVCATEGLMQMLNERELSGVMAHELAHVQHRDILLQSIAVMIGSAISMLGYMFMFGGGQQSDEEGEGGSNPLVMIAFMLLAPLAAGIIQMAISRQREYAADSKGAEMHGDPMDLATALEKVNAAAHRIPLDANPAMNALMIVEPKNLVGGLANLFSTHPPLEKRLMNLIGRETSGKFAYAMGR